MAARYWCHMCSQVVNPVIDAEIKCPYCQNGFVEEMSGEVQDQEIEFGTDRALSQWGPIMAGMMNYPRRRRREDDGEIDLDREVDSIIRRRRRSSAAILQLLQGIREGINSDHESSYLAGPELNHLLRTLTDNDPTRRQGTRPARKEVVENLPTVKVSEPLQCSVCLDEFDKGSEAKEMSCKHKFHVKCIVLWLEIHGSCPVCRYELPDGEELKVDLVGTRTRSFGINLSSENVEEDARNASGSERRFSLPWPLSGLFSSSSSSSGSTSGSSQVNGNSS